MGVKFHPNRIPHPGELEALRDAHEARLAAESAWAEALREARAAGATLQQIADVIGVSKAGAKYLLERSK